MKVLNFSVVGILPSLLDKSKVQTIRPAWNRNWDKTFTGTNTEFMDKYGNHFYFDAKTGDIIGINPPPRFKVKEKVKIMWKQGSKYTCFSRDNGSPYPDNFLPPAKYIFSKTLGTVEITEVFKILLWRTGISIEKINHKMEKFEFFNHATLMISRLMWDLAERDGFNSSKELFKVLDKMYDLSPSKEFWVYRWKWLDGS